MVRRLSLFLLLAMLLTAACAGPVTSPSPSTASTPSGGLTSPDASATPSEGAPSVAPTTEPPPSPSDVAPSPSASASPTGSPTTDTMTVRAYFLMNDVSGDGPFLVPVLRNVPESKGVAKAAMTALLAGPSEAEGAADPSIGTAIPAGTELLGITISDGLATVDLTGTFASGGGTFSMSARLAQVTYTMTQFATVDRVQFELDGDPVEVFSSEGIVLDDPVSRATYRDLLPAIFVDRPAWGATLANPARVRGLANVFEAQFRLALLDGSGRVLLDRPVMATCGTGCWGTFDLNLTYDVSKSQWGTLRVWDPSEKDGSPQYVREYPVYLRAAP